MTKFSSPKNEKIAENSSLEQIIGLLFFLSVRIFSFLNLKNLIFPELIGNFPYELYGKIRFFFFLSYEVRRDKNIPKNRDKDERSLAYDR
ncbi:MAG: hypothetical protein ACI4EG_01535 [Fusicatenibacter sp.]